MIAPRNAVKTRPVMTAAVFALVAAAALMLALTLAPSAKADWVNGYRHKYQGRIIDSPTYYFGFDRKKDKVSKIAALVPLICNETGGYGLPLPIQVKGKHKIVNNRLKLNKNLKLRLPGPQEDAPKLSGTLRINLKFSGKGNRKATGSIKPSIKLRFGSERLTCAFGRLDLAARKGARVNPAFS